jgi:DNA-binding response OmpR family regulator
MRILIAEDDSSLASFVKKGLDAEHYTVDVSSDGEQARAMAGEFDDDLVVLDLSLPRLDGVAILRYLHTSKPSMPIIIPAGTDPGAAATLPSTGAIGADGGRLEARPG